MEVKGLGHFGVKSPVEKITLKYGLSIQDDVYINTNLHIIFDVRT